MAKKAMSRKELMTIIGECGNVIFPQADNFFKLSKVVNLNNDRFSDKHLAKVYAVDVDSLSVYVKNDLQEHGRGTLIPMSVLNHSVLVQLASQILCDTIELRKKGDA